MKVLLSLRDHRAGIDFPLEVDDASYSSIRASLGPIASSLLPSGVKLFQGIPVELMDKEKRVLYTLTLRGFSA